MRGDLRGSSEGSVVASVVCVVGIVMGSVVGISAGTGSFEMDVRVGGSLVRVCRRCMPAAVRVIYGAVGLVDVGICAGSPFEFGHGSVARSYVGVSVGRAPVNLRMAAIVVMNNCLHVVRGSISMQRMSSWATWAVCSTGVSTGSWQWVGNNSNDPEMRIARVSWT